MDILLAHGYFMYDDPHELAVMRPYPPLGILSISAYLKRAGFAVEVFDTTFSSIAAFERAIDERRPPVVGLYCNMMTRRNVVKLAAFCKKRGITVVLGGPDPANYLDEYLAHDADIIVIGEGEQTMAELLPHLARHGLEGLEAINGIAFRGADGQLVRTPARAMIDSLDSLPFPDRAAIDIQQYVDVWRKHHGQGSVSLITARGCPYTCTWCSHAVYGYSHRRRSPENVADEIELIMATYKPDMVWFADDVFTINHRWLFSYAAELKRRGLRVPFETISREDRLNEEVVKTLAEMGCFRIWVGAESGSQRILDAMKRKTDATRMREMIRLLQKYGIEAGTFIMLGFDGEDISDIEATVRHLTDAIPDRLLTTVAYPIKNTPYYQQVADRVIPLRAWAEGSDRDYTVAGRYSQRFYGYATRWMVNEVAWRKQRRSDRPDYRLLAKSFVSAKIGRVGMLLTKGEVENRPGLSPQEGA
ncbi:MAG TPA: radical SAM protein [Herpetosiphonaceae bacterium]|nr:radical SAM protein [Herpetosiphonaceae bacterium]